MYKELYPARSCQNVSPFYDHYGRVVLGGDIIGSCNPGPNSKASSVIMAYWSYSGTVSSIDYTRMLVGVVQYFVRNKVTISDSDTTDENVEHAFAYVKWKKLHPKFDWFGQSATVCINDTEESNFLPVQRISCRCAHVLLPVKFETHEENVFIACPLPIRYYM